MLVRSAAQQAVASMIRPSPSAQSRKWM